MLPPQPTEHTSLLNQEMKNPHLVETLVEINPTTGRLIQAGTPFVDWVADPQGNGNTREWQTYQEKMAGVIPQLEVTFNIQGVPLVLTAQSYLTLRFKPLLPETPVALQSVTGTPLRTSFEIDRSGWPKLNSLVISNAQATLSNFGTESYYGFFNNYIRALRLPEEIRNNMGRQFNENISVSTFNALFEGNAAAAQDYATTEYVSVARDAHLYECTMTRTALRSVQWSEDNTFEVRIPLADILPVFQVPVLPLGQTNTSGIQLRLVLRSPKHLFFMSRCFKAPVLWNGYGINSLNMTGLRYGVVDTRRIGNPIDVPPLGNIPQAAAGQSDPNTLIGYDVRLIEALGRVSNVQAGAPAGGDAFSFFACDVQTEAFLNLKVLTNPLLNPLSEAYLQPFINEMNEFRAKFTDSFVYSQSLTLTAGVPRQFKFTPSQLFYNATHVGLFFYTRSTQWNAPNAAQQAAILTAIRTQFQGRPFNASFTEIAAGAGPIHGYYSLPSSVGISQFQIGLGSSATPLYEQPLDKVGMLAATEDCFKKYNPAEMYGLTVQSRKRLSQGDAFFLFDLTHSRDSGYFIDADNMISVQGTLTYTRGAAADNQPVLLRDTLDVEVVLVIFYQNTFTVLLDLDGSVLIQQT